MQNGDYFIGPAMIVDDKIDDEQSSMKSIVEQLRAAGMPVMTRAELPEDDEVRHWGAFALIILDWELLSLGPGIDLPEELRQQNAATVSAFVARLLADFYCPIFILSGHGLDEIRDQLAQRLELQAHQLDARVLIKSKASVGTDLLHELEGWVRDHPAIYTLKCWELGYRGARRSMFTDFELSSGDWPQILWKASEGDKVNPHFELTEAISRNLLHRFEPLVFDVDVLNAHGVAESSTETVMRVVHRRAVVPSSSLHADVLLPGDFFAIPDSDDILINVTPACDLVPRGDDENDKRMTVVRAARLPFSETDSKSKVEKLRKNNEPTTEYLWIMSDRRAIYRVDFKSWQEASSTEQMPRRLGRLLEPYIVHLQQRFALHFHRQGLPRLPEVLYEALTAPTHPLPAPASTSG